MYCINKKFLFYNQAPQFQFVSASSTNGSINISWAFTHTGGLKIDLRVFCNILNDGRGSDIAGLLSYEYNKSSTEMLKGSTSLSPVYAGKSYFCSVTAVNVNGSDSMNFSNIVINEGGKALKCCYFFRLSLSPQAYLRYLCYQNLYMYILD